jgi:chromosome segregation ATPase
MYFLTSKFTPMVITDISQLNAECNTWRGQMRKYRDEITHLKHQLRQIALKATRYDQLQDVEHYENQFHIQLINIHDLKHSIKVHDYKTSLVNQNNGGKVNHLTLAEHEHLYAEYQRLQTLLDELKARFQQFVAKLN